jgi:hypothetical protein
MNYSFELLDDFPSNSRMEGRRMEGNPSVQYNPQYNPQYLKFPIANYTSRYNNIQNISPNYATDDQPHITNYDMTYPGFLEAKPIHNISARKYESKDTRDYGNNYNYPNTDNLYYKKGNCLENFQHIQSCPLCSKLAKTHIKLYQIIIAILVLIIIFVLLSRKNGPKVS